MGVNGFLAKLALPVGRPNHANTSCWGRCSSMRLETRLPLKHPHIKFTGLDLFWNVSQTNLDRNVVRPGEQTSNVHHSVLESNEDYGGSVIVRRPGCRSSTVDWTVMETETFRWYPLKQHRDHHLAIPSPGQDNLTSLGNRANLIVNTMRGTTTTTSW